MNTTTCLPENGSREPTNLSRKEIFVVNRGEIELGVKAILPDHTLDAGIAKINTTLMEVVVRLPPWKERTRFVPIEGPGRDETVASLISNGYSPTKIVQAVTLRESCWFPFRTVSFICRGDVFVAPLVDGVARECYAFWNHQERRFDLIAKSNGWKPQLFEALTRIEKLD